MDDIDQFILDATTRKPHNIWEEGTKYLREIILPRLAARTKLPENMVIYAVHQNRGRCYWKQRRITVPAWAFNHKDAKDEIEKREYLEWYLGHELAHQANFDEHGRNQDNHGPKFMKHLIRIVPPNATRFEVGYKPRNARSAGIDNININDL